MERSITENDQSSMTLQELIEKLHVIFADDQVNADEVHSVMESYSSQRNEWRKFASFDPYRYTRNLVDEGNGKFNLIVLCWGEGQGSGIHDHSDAHCFMKVLDGELQETLYGWPQDGIENEKMDPLRKNIYRRNQVAYINDSLGLHRVENPSHTNQAVSLHLYSPPFKACHSFDERTGKKRSCQVTFWSQYGVRTPYV
eukprot:gene3725-14999_t